MQLDVRCWWEGPSPEATRPWPVGSGISYKGDDWNVVKRCKGYVILQGKKTGKRWRVPWGEMPRWDPSPPKLEKKEPAKKQGGKKTAEQPQQLPGYAAKWRTSNDFFNHSAKELVKSENRRSLGITVLVLWFLWNGINRKGLVCVSQRQIAAILGVRPNTVNAAFKRLREMGLVQVVCQGGYRKGSSVYKVNGLIWAGHKQARKRT
jgi:hypothetical protein